MSGGAGALLWQVAAGVQASWRASDVEAWWACGAEAQWANGQAMYRPVEEPSMG
jgi:hypothetical protein